MKRTALLLMLLFIFTPALAEQLGFSSVKSVSGGYNHHKSINAPASGTSLVRLLASPRLFIPALTALDHGVNKFVSWWAQDEGVDKELLEKIKGDNEDEIVFDLDQAFKNSTKWQEKSIFDEALGEGQYEEEEEEDFSMDPKKAAKKWAAAEYGYEDDRENQLKITNEDRIEPEIKDAEIGDGYNQIAPSEPVKKVTKSEWISQAMKGGDQGTGGASKTQKSEGTEVELLTPFDGTWDNENDIEDVEELKKCLKEKRENLGVRILELKNTKDSKEQLNIIIELLNKNLIKALSIEHYENCSDAKLFASLMKALTNAISNNKCN